MSSKLFDLEPPRRDAILNAALKEFVSRGFDQASTNIIAKEAGISKALMFHYVKNKQELFLQVYDYFSNLLNEEYFIRMDFTEKDIFARLRQSYLLQLGLLKRHPWIIEFDKLAKPAKSDEINRALAERAGHRQDAWECRMFELIDVSKFRTGLNIGKCKQFIYWSNIGFTNQILDEIRAAQAGSPDYDSIVRTLDEYFDELRNVFYQSNQE